ncbi:MAG: nickel pincer cofactor biosynthesis protein LarC [Desulfonatronovibrionaceae bacterium]
MAVSLYMDCTNGISGDMFLAAAAGLGVDLQALQEVFVSAGLDVRLKLTQEKRSGIGGNRVQVLTGEAQPLRHLPEIEGLVADLDYTSGVKQKTIEAFRRLARAEAEVHGVPESKVHFHETGAVDTIVDVFGAFWAVRELGAKEVLCSALPWFSGRVECEHGVLPLPAPATVELMRDKPVMPSWINFEAVTPTGALLVDRLVDGFSSPQGRLRASGTGFGATSKGFNGLRLFVFTPDERGSDWVWVLESNVDHLSGEEIGVFIQEMQACGALDVVYLPGTMKKNRPGGVLKVLSAPRDLDRVRQAFFQHSLTLGIREDLVRRSTLERRPQTRHTFWGRLPGKAFFLYGKKFWRPEMDEVIKKAKEAGITAAQFLNRLHSRD